MNDNLPSPRALAPPPLATATRRRLGVGALAGLLAALLTMGCQSTRLRPGSLPLELQAQPFRSPQALDLSRLASPQAPTTVVQAGDVLELSIASGVAAADVKAQPVRVDEQGNADLPLLGTIRLAGYQISDAERVVQTESVRRGVFLHPQVSLTSVDRRVHRVTVTGAVTNPGVKELPANGCDLFAALSAAGQFSKDASTRVELMLPGGFGPDGQPQAGRTMSIDLEQATQSGGDFRLPDGAAVMVVRREPPAIHVTGLVSRPSRVEVPPDKELRLLDAITQAGGRQLEVADKIYITRTDPATGQARLIQASYRAAQKDQRENLVLANGDLVSVEETPVTFFLTTIRNFIRFGFSSQIPGL